jgi:phosphatidylglycerol:prolipoprotein diacylglycerol transferase
MTLLNLLTYIIWDTNPDIFVIPGLNHPVRWYGLLWAIALVISQQIMTYIYKKEGRSEKEVDTMTLYIVLGTILGARLGHVLFYDPAYYFQHPIEIFYIWEGGLASHGGTIGILLAAYLFVRKTKVSYLWLLDRLTIVAALCSCLIRVGNLMNSEMIGTPTTLPWAFIFTAIDGVPRHPAQLYEAISCFFLFLLMFWMWYKHRSKLKNGFMLGWFLIILFGFRFVDEYFKVSQESFEDGMILNMGQILSIPFVLAGVVILLQSMRKSAVNQASPKG